MPSRSHQTISERAMQTAELRIPELAAKAGYRAYEAALSSTGAVVVKNSRGQVVERRADGSSMVIKELSLGKRVKVGAVLKRAKQVAVT